VNELQLFNVSGADMRFGMTDDGKPYCIAADYAKAMGYSRTSDALKLLDEDEKGAAICRTPGGQQELRVIFEDGMWELIFRSSLPGAKVIKKQVKAILRQIRETGSYSAAPPPPVQLSNRDLARMVIEEADRADLAEQKVKELEPSARSWDILASAKGDYSLRDAALILNRDPGITTGQNLLKRELARLGMIDRWGVPYARHKQHLTERPRTYTDRDSGEERQAKPQIRITMLGVRYLHGKLGGVAPLRFDQPPLDEAG
jgi:anti-repressor protein